MRLILILLLAFTVSAHARDPRCEKLEKLAQTHTESQDTPKQAKLREKLTAWYKRNC